MTSSTDSSKYKLCRDLPGQKGPIFEEWYKDFMDASGGEGDEDASWAQTFTGTDRRAGLSAAEQRRRVVRNRKAVAKLLEVIPDKDLKAEIRSSAVNRPAGGPGLTTDANVAHQVLVREMRVPFSSGRIQAALTAYNSIAIRTHVGVAEGSISTLNRKLTAENDDLPAANKFSTDQMVEKFLAAIVLPQSVATQADSLLNTSYANLSDQFYQQAVAPAPPFAAVPGGWRRAAVVEYFDEMWRAAWKRGDPELKFATATLSRDRAGPSPRADGMMAEDSGFAASEQEFNWDAHASHVDSLFHVSDARGVNAATNEYLDEDPTRFDTAQVAIVKIAGIFAEIDDANAAHDAAVAYIDTLHEDIAHEAMEKLRTMICYKCYGEGRRAVEVRGARDRPQPRQAHHHHHAVHVRRHDVRQVHEWRPDQNAQVARGQRRGAAVGLHADPARVR